MAALTVASINQKPVFRPITVDQKLPVLPAEFVENASTNLQRSTYTDAKTGRSAGSNLNFRSKPLASKWTACAIATTTLQPKPDAKPKTAVSAKTYRSRSSRDGFTSSSNLKIKI
jgi:hypothetical protein